MNIFKEEDGIPTIKELCRDNLLIIDEVHNLRNYMDSIRWEGTALCAMKSSKRLLLSIKARVNSKPELEILADDVRCSHGVTIGNLSLEQMFYLRSRGIPEVEARKLLVSSFGNIIIDDLNKNFIDRAQKMMSDYFNE